MKPKILIVGATGVTGGHATRMLLELGYPVRALVHREDDRAHRLKALGAEIFIGEVLDLRALRQAFVDVQRAYFVYPVRPGLVEATTKFALAAAEAKAEFLVNLSQWTCRPDASSDSAMDHWASERLLDWSPTPVAHLRPTAFQEWLLYELKAIREGRYAVPWGPKGRFAPISGAEQGAAIAAILADPTGHSGQIYPLMGAEDLTNPEIVEIVSRTLGKPIRYEHITGEQWVEEFGIFKTPYLVQHITGVAEMHAQGLMAGTNGAVEQLTGRPPMTVAAFVEKHRAAFA
jgi:NAD(P)H dehydrogenase (quinone)